RLVRTAPTAALSLSLRNHTIDISYDPERQILQVSRQNWADNGVQTRDIPLPVLTELDIFSDASSVEIFINNGAAVFSMRYFTGVENLRIDYTGLAQEERLEYYTL
ncbi:MAG: GH32 C-terminal domain-containing protein, partial [Oscillospiraceae bacterium]|nr:GH32 C-terminal domain-containing protein [Oscillospiraceae bacterium]